MKHDEPRADGDGRTSTPLRRGHWRALALLEATDTVRATLDRFEAALGGETVYLRPTDAGLVPISLAPDAVKMVGVGRGACALKTLPPAAARVAAAVADYREKSGVFRSRSPRGARACWGGTPRRVVSR